MHKAKENHSLVKKSRPALSNYYLEINCYVLLSVQLSIAKEDLPHLKAAGDDAMRLLEIVQKRENKSNHSYHVKSIPSI